MAKDLHEEILLYLYEFRNDSKFHDIFERFKQDDHEAIYDKYSQLQKEHLVEAEPQTKVTSISSQELDFFRVTNYRYSLGLRITIPKGTDYVNDKVIPRIYQIKKWSRIVSMTGVIFGMIMTLVTCERDHKYQKEHQLNTELQIKVDSLTRTHNTEKAYFDSIRQKNEIRIIELEDSLKNEHP